MSTPILFNITIKIQNDHSQNWFERMTKEYLPECTDGTIVTESQINRLVLEEVDEGETFAVQFVYASKDVFIDNKLSTMERFFGLVDKEFGGKYVYFPTVMELLYRNS
jgi:hypothetical protein